MHLSVYSITFFLLDQGVIDSPVLKKAILIYFLTLKKEFTIGVSSIIITTSPIQIVHSTTSPFVIFLDGETHTANTLIAVRKTVFVELAVHDNMVIGRMGDV